MRTYQIIADIGSNYIHKHDLIKTVRLMPADVNYFKLQRFTKRELYGAQADCDEYNLPIQWLEEIKEEMATYLPTSILAVSAFSRRGIDQIAPLVGALKIASSESTDLCLVAYAASVARSLNIELFVSNSYHDLDHVKALAVAAPDAKLLYCPAGYPPTDYNFDFAPDVACHGFSCHFPTVSVALTAAKFGAKYVEKHVNLLGIKESPDAPFSIDEEQLADLINGTVVRPANKYQRRYLRPRI